MTFSENFLHVMEFEKLLRGELLLTFNVLFGLFIGAVMVKFSVPERLLGRLRPLIEKLRMSSHILVALAMSIGSSRAASATLASAYSAKVIDEQETVWGTLMLSFPGYLKRWFSSTLPVSMGLAGPAGLIYALLLLLRSFIRFIFFAFLLIGKTEEDRKEVTLKEEVKGRPVSFVSMAKKTLPWGWGCYAVFFYLVPLLQPYTESWSKVLPILNPLGWSIAIAGMAHNTLALASAGAALSSGELGVTETLLALLVGNAVGVISRVARQNLSFWMGIFPKKTVGKLLLWHLSTLIPLMLLWIFIVFAMTRLI